MNKTIKMCLMLALLFSISVYGYAKRLPLQVGKIIYESNVKMEFDTKNYDGIENLAAAMGSMGKTTITDIGIGYYRVDMKTGGGAAFSDIILSPKVVNERLIQFVLNSKDKDIVSITPEEINIGGGFKLIVLDKDAFGKLLKNLGGVSRQSGNTGGKTHSTGQNSSESQTRPVQKNQPGITEPDKELTISDMLYKPMGILTASSNIWGMQYKDVLSAARQRDNWEISSLGDMYDSSFTVFGNNNYGKKKSKGYNMTYKGEPCFSMGVRAANYGAPSGKGKVESYKYSFLRNIKGKVPSLSSYRKDEILKEPQWTQDEALDFAKTMVADLESVGIRMTKTKNLKGDIYTMKGIDNKTNSEITVRVFKINNKLSAFFSVSLVVKNIEKL